MSIHLSHGIIVALYLTIHTVIFILLTVVPFGCAHFDAHTQSLQVAVLVIALIFIIFHKCIVLWHFPLISKMWSLSWVTDDNLGKINTKNLPGHITCKNAHTCRGLYWRSTQFLYQLNGISFLESYVVSIYLQSVFILYLDA